MSLPVNYKDDLLDTTQNTHRRYAIKKTSDDSTIQADVYLEDITEYTQEGDNFGAQDLNNTNKAINDATDTHTFTITTSDWVTNDNTRNNETYTVKQVISTTTYANTPSDKHLEYIPMSATVGAVMTNAEEEDAIKLGDIETSATNITIYAQEATENTLRIQIKGV